MKENEILIQEARDVFLKNLGKSLFGFIFIIILFLLTLPVLFVGIVYSLQFFFSSYRGYDTTIIIGFVAILLTFVCQAFFLLPQMNIGFYRFYLILSRGEDAGFGELFYGFKKYLASIGLFGGTEMTRYSRGNPFRFLLLADNTSLTVDEIKNLSIEMMMNNRKKYFSLLVNFTHFGFVVLSFVTFGIGFLFFIPYIMIVTAKLYDDIKVSNLEQYTNLSSR
jgi:hypothetical protein